MCWPGRAYGPNKHGTRIFILVTDTGTRYVIGWSTLPLRALSRLMFHVIYFWAEYPYFLPCLAVAAYCCVSWIIMAMFLEDVRPRLFWRM
jgi:hypothetical protein